MLGASWGTANQAMLPHKLAGRTGADCPARGHGALPLLHRPWRYGTESDKFSYLSLYDTPAQHPALPLMGAPSKARCKACSSTAQSRRGRRSHPPSPLLASSPHSLLLTAHKYLHLFIVAGTAR